MSLNWLQRHLEEFVIPILRRMPVASNHQYLTADEMSRIKNAWRAVKKNANRKTILLAGRDVWIFEVLARREEYPTIFRPDISRLAVSYVKEDYSKLHLLDTGFAGSIPKALNIADYTMLSSAQNVKISPDIRHQIFPRMVGSRSLALKIEHLPKYWKSGFVRDGEIYQEITDNLVEFENAAQLTIQVYKDSSPKLSHNKLVAVRSLNSVL